eukprot:symbB.v1.2.031817.t1/scaffold3720.1/size51473/1
MWPGHHDLARKKEGRLGERVVKSEIYGDFEGYSPHGAITPVPTQINSTLFNDLLMAIGSIAFVILYLRIHTGWWIISISSFLIIFTSVPLAYIMTPAAKATIASFLSVFLITGIGCDVVFVFTDFWEQGHKLPLESRLMWMIVHAGESCLATSITTA